MTHEELNIKAISYEFSKNNQFIVQLNEKYNDLCFAIRKKKWASQSYLREICILILENWEYAKKLPKEELYMVLNSIKLARSVGVLGSHDAVFTTFTMQEFNKLAENYTNSR